MTGELSWPSSQINTERAGESGAAPAAAAEAEAVILIEFTFRCPE